MPLPHSPNRALLALLPLLAFACSKEEVPPQLMETQEAAVAPATPAVDYSQDYWSSAMTAEERKASLEQRIKNGKEPFHIDIHDLGGWEFDERKEQPFPDYILALNGKEVIMRGFMMPDIDFEHIRSFHLVRSLYSCCFGAPPQLNEILRVELHDQEGMDYTYNTVEVRGHLQIVFAIEDGLVEDLYRMEDASYRILEFDDPVAPSAFDAATGFDGVIPAPGSQF